MTNKYQRAINSMFGGRSIAYNASLAKVLGSVKAGILMSQLLYWDGKGSKVNWVYKTADELYDETALTRSEQESAIRKCKAVGVLNVKLAGIPAKRHFQIIKEKLIDLLSSLPKNGKLASHRISNSVTKNREPTPDMTKIENSEIGIIKYQATKLASKFKI